MLKIFLSKTSLLLEFSFKNFLNLKQKQLPLADLITYIIIEDTNRKESRAAKARALASQANLIQNNTNQKKRYDNKPNHKPGHNKNNHVPVLLIPLSKIMWTTLLCMW